MCRCAHCAGWQSMAAAERFVQHTGMQEGNIPSLSQTKEQGAPAILRRHTRTHIMRSATHTRSSGAPRHAEHCRHSSPGRRAVHLIALWWYVAWRSMVPLMPSCIVALLQAIVNARGIPCLVNLLSSPSAAVQVLSTLPRALPFRHCLKPDHRVFAASCGAVPAACTPRNSRAGGGGGGALLCLLSDGMQACGGGARSGAKPPGPCAQERAAVGLKPAVVAGAGAAAGRALPIGNDQRAGAGAHDATAPIVLAGGCSNMKRLFSGAVASISGILASIQACCAAGGFAGGGGALEPCDQLGRADADH